MKRGISPLIATILLIGFTVILAAVVFTWGQGWFGSLVEGASESTNLQLACTNKGGLTISDICLMETATRITLINTGTIPYDSCSLAGGGESVQCGNLTVGGVDTVSLPALLEAGDPVSSVYTITTDVGVATCQGSSYTVSPQGLREC